METEHPTQALPPSALEVNGGQIEGLPRNPRLIRDARFKKLKQSLKDSPEFMSLRPVIAVSQGVGKPAVVICGNMRLRACLDLGWTEIPTIVLPGDTPVEKLREYAIKDNVPYGETDWDIVANEWDTSELEGWGFEMPTEWGVNPADYGDDFSLPSGGKGLAQMSFVLANEQVAGIKDALATAKRDGDECETFGNVNGNGNALYKIVTQWAGQRK